MKPWPLVSVDPGEEHVGIAFFESKRNGDLYVADAYTLGHQQAVDYLWTAIVRFEIAEMCCEQWRVYPEMANWSECRTAEIIGIIRHLCRRNQIRFATVPARAKGPAGGHVRRERLSLIGDTVHARDAELIGYAYLNGVKAT